MASSSALFLRRSSKVGTDEATGCGVGDKSQLLVSIRKGSVYFNLLEPILNDAILLEYSSQ